MLLKTAMERERIWDRQVKNFWEINWVVAPDISAMNSRKNWRKLANLDDEARRSLHHKWATGRSFQDLFVQKRGKSTNQFWNSLFSQKEMANRKLGKT